MAKQRIMTNPYKLLQSLFILTRELNKDPSKLHGFYRMSIETFQELVKCIKS